MPDLSYGDLVQTTRSSSGYSQTNALAVIPLESDYKGTDLFKPYCKIEDVKAYIRNSEYDDGFYAQAINQASRMVDKFTQRNYWQNDYRTTAYRATDVYEKTVYFPFPIRTITEVKVGDAVVSKEDYFFKSIEDEQDARNFYIELEHISDSDLSNLASVDLINNDINATPKKVMVKGLFGYTVRTTSQMPIDPLFPAEVRRATTMIAGTLTDQFRKESVDKDGNRQNLLETMIPYDAIKLLKKSKRCVL